MYKQIAPTTHETPKATLELLNAIYPIEGLVCVGAVDSELMHAINALAPQNALYIDNTESNITALQKRGLLIGWKTALAKLADQTGRRAFHRYSLSIANGLTPPEQIKSIWPNVKHESVEDHPCTTLDALLHPSKAQGETHNWFVINAIEAQDLLNGAENTLQATDVLIVLQHGPIDLQYQYSQYLQDSEETITFKYAAQLPCRQPMHSGVVYRNDWKAHARIQKQQHGQETKRLNQSIAEKEHQTQERLQQIKQLITERDQSKQKTAETEQSNARLIEQLEELTQQAEQQQEKHKTLQKMVETLTKERDQKCARSLELQVQVANITQDLRVSESEQDTLLQRISILEGNKKALATQVEAFENQLEFLKSFINGS